VDNADRESKSGNEFESKSGRESGSKSELVFVSKLTFQKINNDGALAVQLCMEVRKTKLLLKMSHRRLLFINQLEPNQFFYFSDNSKVHHRLYADYDCIIENFNK
jgi:hypothetical protein